jgi:hypothetical protein
MHSIRQLCERAYLFERGQIQATGRADEVIDAYMARQMAAGGDPHGLVVIPPDAARLGGESARATRIAVLDATDTPTREIRLGQPFAARAVFELEEPVPDAVVELGISSPEGTRVVTVQNIDGGRLPEALAAGRHEIDIEVDVTLLPGDFVLDVALTRRDGTTLDFVERAMRFRVSAIPQTPADAYPWNVVRGYTRPPSRWRARSASLEPADVA